MPTNTQITSGGRNVNRTILDALKALAQASVSYGSPSPLGMGAAMAQSPATRGTLGSLASVSAPAVGAEMGVDLNKAMAGKGMAEASETPDSIVADTAIKTAKSAVKKQTEQLLAQGVAPEQIIETSMGKGTMQGIQPSMQPAPQPVQQPQQQVGYGSPVSRPMNKVGNVLADILTLGGVLKSPDYARDRLALEQAKTLRHQRETGMTAAELGKQGAKLAIERMKIYADEATDLAKAGRLTAKDLFTQYEKSSGEFVSMRDAMGRIAASAEDPSPAGDLALIFNYMKVLDPDSTVREGEFANAENSGSVPDRIWKTYNKVISGKRLNKKMRNDFVDRAQRIFKQAERQQMSNVKRFKTLAKQNKIDPTSFMSDLGLAQKQGETVEGGFQTTSAGNKYRRAS